MVYGDGEKSIAWAVKEFLVVDEFSSFSSVSESSSSSSSKPT